jgi:Kdo2-lipid IVA lauroyltransferase/acyltransferase
MNDIGEMAPPFRWAFLAPRYWPVWFGVALLRLLTLLPVPVLIPLGEGIGWLFGRLVPSRRHVVRVNLRACFPEQPAHTLEQRIDEHFRALGAGVFEACLAWWASDARLRRHSEVIGLEHLDAALADGSGVLLLTGHFTTLELCARRVAMDRPLHAMYRPIKNPLVDFLMHRWRAKVAGLPAMPREELRPLVRALRQGRIVWYGPDQTLDRREGVFVPFFGVPTLMITATARLAGMGRARIVPYFPQRIGSRYRITVLPALEGFPSGDDAADAARIMQVIEQGVRAAPAQYFWVHRRFKVRPAGAPKLY